MCDDLSSTYKYSLCACMYACMCACVRACECFDGGVVFLELSSFKPIITYLK